MQLSILFFNILCLPILAQAFLEAASGVTCVGPLPPFSFFSPPLPDGQTVTLQHICANTDHGGVEGYTTQGFCAGRSTEPLSPFASGPRLENWEYRVSSSALTPGGGFMRLSQYCAQRCQCNVESEDLRAPLDYVSDADMWKPPPALDYRINLHLYNDHQLDVYNGQSTVRERLELSTYEDPDQDLGAATLPDLETTRVTRKSFRLKSEHLITCVGDLPTDPLPQGQDPNIYDNNLLRLCAVPLGGGHYKANAGAYCRPLANNEGDIDFADEMTPQKEWTWDYGQYEHDIGLPHAAPKVRNYCWNHCTCVNRQLPKNRPLDVVWHWLTVYQIGFLTEKLVAPPPPLKLPAQDPERPAGIGCFDQPNCIIESVYGHAGGQCGLGTAPADTKYLCQLNSDGLPTVPSISVPIDPSGVQVTSDPDHETCTGNGYCWTFSGNGCGGDSCKCGVSFVTLLFWYASACYAKHAFDPNGHNELRHRSLPDFSSIGESHRPVPRDLYLHHLHQQTQHKRDTSLVLNLAGANNSVNFTGLFNQSAMVVVTNQNPVNPPGLLPAPCNASYVSLACANSSDGIVHEPANMWLGAVLPANFSMDMPPPRVPDAFYEAHNLVRAGNNGYLALASSLSPDEAYTDGGFDDGNSSTTAPAVNSTAGNGASSGTPDPNILNTADPVGTA